MGSEGAANTGGGDWRTNTFQFIRAVAAVAAAPMSDDGASSSVAIFTPREWHNRLMRENAGW